MFDCERKWSSNRERIAGAQIPDQGQEHQLPRSLHQSYDSEEKRIDLELQKKK